MTIPLRTSRRVSYEREAGPGATPLKIIARVLLLATLVFGSGCAKSDWIERTLVTVDVTGTWRSGSVGGAGGANVGGTIWLELEQQGATVKGSMQYVGLRSPSLSAEMRAIHGTVTGDVFRFHQESGPVEGELTLSGDEMVGQAWVVDRLRPVSFRRVDPSTRPPAEPR